MKIVILRWNNITFDIEEELKRRGHEVIAAKMINEDELKKFDVFVTWNEAETSGARDYIRYCNANGIRTVLLQHGRRGSSRVYPPFNEELLSQKVCCWGENDKKRFLSFGIPDMRLKVTSTPIFKYLKPRENHEGINVVFSPEHWDTDVVENQIVAAQLRKLKGVNIITKCLKGEHLENFYDNPVFSKREEKGHLEKVADVLKTADLVIGISESTFELMAQILDIPVIISDIWIPRPCSGDERYLVYKRQYSNACERIKDIDGLNKAIYKRLKHPEFLKEERAQVAIDDGGININDPLKEICDLIENEQTK
jgi:hypothetical protein